MQKKTKRQVWHKIKVMQTSIERVRRVTDLLHNGHTDLVLCHLCTQSKWNTCPQLPKAILNPFSLLVVGEAWYSIYIKNLTILILEFISITAIILTYGRFIQRVTTYSTCICAYIPLPHAHSVPDKSQNEF